MKNVHNDTDPKDPKKGVNNEPAEEQQLEKDNPVKPEVEREEEELDIELNDPEFDEYDEDGGDEDFKDEKKAKEISDKSKGEKDPLDGVEGSDRHITNSEVEIVNKKGQ